ncbi:MAG: hypothetical protein RIR11_1838 [Bacteroidota bacterium]|jgi:hypothetical protein
MRILTLLFCLFPAFVNAQSADPKVISGTVLLNSKTAPDFKKIIADLPKNWYVRTDSISISDKTAVFSTPGATVMLAYLDYPVGPDEMQIAAGISWLWKDAEKEVKNHKAQLVISVLGDPKSTLELYRIFTRTAAGTMTHLTDAPGIYMNAQYLLISKGYYLESARNMGRDGVPLYCWVYFGMLQQGEKTSGYTYGLTEFGQNELELVESTLSLQDGHSLLYEAAQKAAASAPWKNGQKVELSENKKISVTISAAKVIKDDSQTGKVSLVKE